MGYLLIETIEFTGIPQDGVDLVLKVSTRSATVYTASKFTLNNDTSASYSRLDLNGNGAQFSSGSFASLNFGIAFYQPTSAYTANTFGNGQMYLSNYTSATNKSISHDSVSENNNTTAFQGLIATSYLTTNPITSIQLFQSSDNFAEYSTASLYKITAD